MTRSRRDAERAMRRSAPLQGPHNRFLRCARKMRSSSPSLAQFHVGSLEFLNDSDVPALQAADVIAWSTRRRKADKPLVGIHDPLSRLFDDCHADSPAPARILQSLSE